MTLGEEDSEILIVICGREEHEVEKRPSVPKTLEKGDLAIASLTVIILRKAGRADTVEIF